MTQELVVPDEPTGATLAEADQWMADALASLEAVETPEAAMELLGKIKLAEQAIKLARLGAERERDWGRVKLLGERRYGELLGAATAGRPAAENVTAGNVLSGAERKALHDARAVAAVPPEIFETYIAREEDFSRAGLLREANKAVIRAPKPAPAIPTGTYSLVLADPPWRYEVPGGNTPELRSIEDNHYQTMTVEEICALEVPSAPDAVLFLWATNPLLREAFQVMEAWGFEYRTNLVWVKDRIGMGYYVRGQHELLLIGRRGNLPVPIPTDRPPSVITAPRTKHSAKPDESYTVVERMYPNATRLEMFARSGREGWTAWGNEA